MSLNTGLTLGKYAPLHKGHEHLIETMLREMDAAIVIIYDTTVTLIPLEKRAGWLRELFPGVRVIEARSGPVGSAHDPEYERREEQFVLNLLGNQNISAFYSSEYYGEHMSRALGCADRRVRKTVPVCASAIRNNPEEYRQYLSETVYRDLKNFEKRES